MQVHSPVNAAQALMVYPLAPVAQAVVAAPEANSGMLLGKKIQLILHGSIVLRLRCVGTGSSWQLHKGAGLPVAALSLFF
jgi:hypothetical protein